MAKITRLLIAEINPLNPVNESLQIIDCLILNNPGNELAIVKGIQEALGGLQKRLEKGEETDGEKISTN